MNKKYFNVPVSLKDNNSRIVEGVIQYDTADLFNIKLFDGTEPFDFSGYSTLVFTALKPDGKEYIDTEGEYLDVVDAADGRIAFTLPPALTAIAGMHFCNITIYSNGVKLSSARFNYFVQEALSEGENAKHTDEYPLLEQLISKLSLIQDAEQMRNEAEALRVLAENERVSDTSGIVAQAQVLALQAQSYAKAAQDWYTLLITYAGDLTGVDLTGIATKQDVEAAVAEIDCGEFTGDSVKYIQFRRGAAGNLPTLRDGEAAWAEGKFYVGDGTQAVQINGAPFIAQATAPADTSKLWIDTGNGNAIKYYDGTKWVGTATATFA